MVRRIVRRNNDETLVKFNKKHLYGINVTIRREMGRDINGACGQLRKSYIDSEILNEKEGE